MNQLKRVRLFGLRTIGLFISLCFILGTTACGSNEIRVKKLYDLGLEGIFWSKDSKNISFLFSNLAEAPPDHPGRQNYYIGVINIASGQFQIIKTLEMTGGISLHGWTQDNSLLMGMAQSETDQFYKVDLNGKTGLLLDRGDLRAYGSGFVTPFPDSLDLLALHSPSHGLPILSYYNEQSKELSRLDFPIPAEFQVQNTAEIIYADVCICHGKKRLYFSNTSDTTLSSGQSINSGQGAYHYYADINLENKKVSNIHLFKSYSIPLSDHPGSEDYPRFLFMGWLSADEFAYTLYSDLRGPKEQKKYYKYNINKQKEEELKLPNYGSLLPNGTFSPDGTKIINIVGTTLYLYDMKTNQSKLLLDADKSLPKGAYRTAT